MTAKKHSPQPRHCHFPRSFETRPATSRPTILQRKRVRQAPTPPDAPERGGSCSTAGPGTAEQAPFRPQSPALRSHTAFPPRPRPPYDGSGPSSRSTTSPALTRLVAPLRPLRPRPCTLLGRASAPSRCSWGLHQASKRNRCSCVWASNLSPWPSDSEQ